MKNNNIVADFLEWILANKLGDPDTGEWDRSRFHNPVKRLTQAGLPTNNQSDKASLSIRYIRELRGMLAEGRNFRDWTWAQQAMEAGNNGGDWFVVDPQLIDSNDPDCVARQRVATKYEIEKKGYLSYFFRGLDYQALLRPHRSMRDTPSHRHWEKCHTQNFLAKLFITNRISPAFKKPCKQSKQTKNLLQFLFFPRNLKTQLPRLAGNNFFLHQMGQPNNLP